MLGQMSLGLVGLRTVDADERPFCGVSLAMLVQALLAGKGGCATVALVRPLLGVNGPDVVLQAPFFNIAFPAEMALLPPTSCTEGNMEHLEANYIHAVVYSSTLKNLLGLHMVIDYISDCIPERTCTKNQSYRRLVRYRYLPINITFVTYPFSSNPPMILTEKKKSLSESNRRFARIYTCCT